VLTTTTTIQSRSNNPPTGGRVDRECMTTTPVVPAHDLHTQQARIAAFARVQQLLLNRLAQTTPSSSDSTLFPYGHTSHFPSSLQQPTRQTGVMHYVHLNTKQCHRRQHGLMLIGD
jgi:hypothetical protein